MSDKNFTYDDFKNLINVSRETFFGLESYVLLLLKWQKQINLISNTTVSDIWRRHVLDSAQLINYVKKTDRIMDVGSGAGFPGIVLAILGVTNITLVESDSRKTAFLREVTRVCNLEVTVLNKRVEDVSQEAVDIVTARAFSSLGGILGVLDKGTRMDYNILLLKGKLFNEEVVEAQQKWTFDYEKFRSITDMQGTVVLLKNVTKTAS